MGAIGLITGPAALVGIVGAARHWEAGETAKLAVFVTLLAALAYFNKAISRWVPASVAVGALIVAIFYFPVRQAGSVDEWCVAMAPLRSFAVVLDLEPGAQRTLVTGADFVVPYPFTRQYKGENGALLSSYEDDFSYTNGRLDDKGDALYELTIVVESSTLQIDPGGTQSGRRKQDNVHAVAARYEVDSGRWSLTARFPKMQSQEKAWLKFRLAK